MAVMRGILLSSNRNMLKSRSLSPEPSLMQSGMGPCKDPTKWEWATCMVPTRTKALSLFPGERSGPDRRSGVPGSLLYSKRPTILLQVDGSLQVGAKRQEGEGDNGDLRVPGDTRDREGEVEAALREVAPLVGAAGLLQVEEEAGLRQVVDILREGAAIRWVAEEVEAVDLHLVVEVGEAAGLLRVEEEVGLLSAECL